MWSTFYREVGPSLGKQSKIFLKVFNFFSSCMTLICSMRRIPPKFIENMQKLTDRKRWTWQLYLYRGLNWKIIEFLVHFFAADKIHIFMFYFKIILFVKTHFTSAKLKMLFENSSLKCSTKKIVLLTLNTVFKLKINM